MRLSQKTKLLLLSLFAVAILIGIAYLLLAPLLVRPSSNFVFMHCEKDYCGNIFAVNAQGDISESSKPVYSDERAKLYYYDVSNDSVREMSFPEANLLRYEPSSTSAKGYTISDDDGLQASKWIFTRQLPLPEELSGDNTFVGWEIK